MRQEVQAQRINDQARHQLTVNAGIQLSNANVIDKSFSSVVYKGNIPGAVLSAIYHKNKSFHELRTSYGRAPLTASLQQKQEMTQTIMTVDYSILFRLKSSDDALFKCKAGAGINVLYAERKYASSFINNNETFEFATSFNGIFESSYFFNNRLAGFSISDRISLPLLSFIKQAPFGGENTVSDRKDSRMVSISSFFRLINFLSLEKKINSRHKVSLSYTWDYYQINRAREIKQANHQLGLTYGFII